MFLLVFSLQLVIYTFHELTEAGALPFVDNEYWHIATEPYGPEGVYGQWLTYLMVLVPVAWLACRLAEGPERAALGGALTPTTRTMYICICNAITERRHPGRRMRRALAGGSRRELGVGLGCGRCTSCAKTMLVETVARLAHARPAAATRSIPRGDAS